MAEQTIRADQIEGLPDLIREQVRAALREDHVDCRIRRHFVHIVWEVILIYLFLLAILVRLFSMS